MTPPTVIFDATGDALATTIGEMFDIPEANLDGQLLEMVSGDNSYQDPLPQSTSSGSNANANDEPIDAALIDLLPF